MQHFAVVSDEKTVPAELKNLIALETSHFESGAKAGEWFGYVLRDLVVHYM